MNDLVLTIGQHEDRTWDVTINGFSVDGYNLQSQVRDETGTLILNLVVVVTSATTFTISCSAAASGFALPGEYSCDIVAISQATGKRVYITDTFTFTIERRITIPV